MMDADKAVTAAFSLKGDLDGNSNLGPADVISGLQALAGIDSVSSTDGDVDGDGKLVWLKLSTCWQK